MEKSHLKEIEEIVKAYILNYRRLKNNDNSYPDFMKSGLNGDNINLLPYPKAKKYYLELPTQFEILEIIFEDRSLYLIFVSQDKTLPDLKNSSISDKFDPKLQENSMKNANKFIKNNLLYNKGEKLRPKSLQNQIQSWVVCEIEKTLNKVENYFRHQSIHDGEKWYGVWTYNGDFSKVDGKRDANDDFFTPVFRSLITGGLLQSATRRVISHEKSIFRAYFNPLCWLGEFPEYSLQDDLMQKPLAKYSTAIIDESVNYDELSMRIKLYNNGLIEVRDVEKTIFLDFMNLFIGSLNLLNIDVFRLTEHDIFSELTKKMGNISTLQFSSHSFPGEDKARESKIRGIYYSSWTLPEKYVLIPYDSVKWAFENTKIYLFTPEKNIFHFLANGYTYFRNFEYNQSFINSWVIIENNLLDRYKQYLKKKGISGKKIKKKCYKMRITDILQKLYSQNSLNSIEFNGLDELRKKRNKLIHNLRSISRELAIECFRWAQKTINMRFFTATPA